MRRVDREVRGGSDSDTGEVDPSAPEGVRAFLIADVRGYTRFTQDRGDEAAAALAGAYAAIVREVVTAAGGVLLELRGDEALAVFASPRQAVRASVALRDRLIDETVANPTRPLAVGMGLDAGEAVPVEGGYRGAPLNVAARLCNAAKAGEIIASREFVHLARKVDGVRYTDLGRLELKGLARSTHAVRIEPEPDDPVRRKAFLAALSESGPSRRKRSLLFVAALVCVALIALSAGLLIRLDGRSPPVSRANAVGTIGLSSGEVGEYVEVGASPLAAAAGAGSVWVTNEGSASISRIDPATRSVVQTVQLDGPPAAIAYGSGAVWVTLPVEGTVVRINPATNTVVQTARTGFDPVDLAVTSTDLWVVNRQENTVVRVDAASGRRVATVPVGTQPAGIAAAGDVWVANTGEGTVTRIDSTTNQVVSEVAVGSGPIDIAAGEGSIWVANSLDGTVSRIDPQRGAVSATIPVGSGPRGIAFGSGSVWITNEFDGSVSRIDPAANSQVDKIEVGSSPQGLAVARDTLWFVSRPLLADHRGGTLRVTGGVDSIDPAISYSFEGWQMLLVTNDGLVGFKKVGGVDGATTVPDLAVSIPLPADGGHTYTFQLRPDVEYSNGKPVLATDFRATFERLFLVDSPGTFFYRGIVGAQDCTSDKCDLSRGIAVDDDARTVTFHLRQPDHEFLHKLALPFAYVLPSGTPDVEAMSPTLPATGPYIVRDFIGERTVLERNPNFVEWSPAAQPDGYADRIVLASPQGDKSAVDAVLAGEADLTLVSAPRLLENLLRDHTERVHTYPRTATFGMVMNTRVSPFDDVRVRRALNFAVDRNQVVELFGGTNHARLTCQILPPIVPGYRPYCPYSIGPEANQWSAPDTGRARALIEAAGVRGERVVVWDTSFFHGVGKYFVTLLRDLGFDAKWKYVSNPEVYFRKVNDSRTRAQIFGNAWFADYASASNFLNTLFSCESFVPNSPVNLNTSGFCNSSVDRNISRSLRLSFTNPSAAYDLWARVDRQIVDLAPWIPILNPSESVFISDRLGNYENHPQWGLLLSRLWVE
jgi:YVTN family beta-propeller protein